MQQLASRIEAYEEAQNIPRKSCRYRRWHHHYLQAYRYDKVRPRCSFGNAFLPASPPRKHEEKPLSFYPRVGYVVAVTLFSWTLSAILACYLRRTRRYKAYRLWNARFSGSTVCCRRTCVSSINGQLDLRNSLKEVFPATMELCILAFGFALMVGIPVGMLAGVTRSKWPIVLSARWRY